MNKVETLNILSTLKVAYPNSFKNKMDRNDQRVYVELWERQFKDYQFRDVKNAVDSIISSNTREFVPNIATIKEMINKLTTPEEMTEQEAWNEVYKAISGKIKFEELKPVLQRLVQSQSQIDEWGRMNTDTVNSVIASNFQRSYRVRHKSEQEYAMLPNSIKQLANNKRKELGNKQEINIIEEYSEEHRDE